MFDVIKKQNGEHFAKAIRNYDNAIFDIPNLDKIVQYAGRDAAPIMNFLVSLKNIQITKMSVHQNPIELLTQAGYDAYVADTLEKQNAIKKYYAPGEQICTFRDPHRFENYYIINAVRKNVKDIKRSSIPKREDEYGTSVISIQVLKTGGFISIKNRYNHTVDNPDNTFNSNPDNIIAGLSDAIKHYFHVDFASQTVELPNNYVFVNNQIIHYNQEINNMYFGDDFYVSNGVIHKLDNNTEYMLGNGVIFNNSTKTARCLQHWRVSFSDISDQLDSDTFVESLNNIFQNKKTAIKSAKDGTRTFFANGVKVIETKNGMLTFIHAPDAKYLYLKNMNLSGNLDFGGVVDINLDSVKFAPDLTLKLNPNAHSIQFNKTEGLSGDLDLSHVKHLSFGADAQLDCSNITSLRFPKSTPSLEMLNINKIRGDLDLSIMRSVSLKYCNLTGTNVITRSDYNIFEMYSVIGLCGKLNLENTREIYLMHSDLSNLSELTTNPNAEIIRLSEIKGLTGNLNFENVDNLRLEEVDFSECPVIKFNHFANSIEVVGCRNLRGNLDFSNVKHINVIGTDFSCVKSLKFPSEIDNFQMITAPNGEFDLSYISRRYLDFAGANLSHVTDLKLPSNLNRIHFSNAKMPNGDVNLYFGQNPQNTVLLDGADFSVSGPINMHGKIRFCSLTNVVGLHGKLDFSNVAEVDLSGTDLSHVRSIKFNPRGKVRGLKPKDRLRFAVINGAQAIKQTVSKVKQKVVKKENRTI